MLSFLFRCDGTNDTGLGHVSRCIALAEALEDRGCDSVFFGNYTQSASMMLNTAGFKFQDMQLESGGKSDLNEVLTHLVSLKIDAIVVDSYLIDSSYLDEFELQGIPVILIDDFKKLQSYDYTAIINFTVNAKKLGYPCDTNICMLGPNNFLARRSIRNIRPNIISSDGRPKNILVAMGGVDPSDLSVKVVSSLLDLVPGVEVKIVVGRSYNNIERLTKLVEEFGNGSCVVEQCPDLSVLFSWCSVCICAGGLTKYEAAYLGIPTLVISQNEEQHEETVSFSALGLVYNLGRLNDSDKSTRTANISSILENKGKRDLLREACLSVFPDDPTKLVADKLIDIIRTEARCE